jgi:hypothetical protein
MLGAIHLVIPYLRELREKGSIPTPHEEEAKINVPNVSSDDIARSPRESLERRRLAAANLELS